MACAVRCHEGLENWEQAELWTQRQTERYASASWANWYLFCKRTGHGNLKAAQTWTEDYLAASELVPGPGEPGDGRVFLLDERLAEESDRPLQQDLHEQPVAWHRRGIDAHRR